MPRSAVSCRVPGRLGHDRQQRPGLARKRWRRCAARPPNGRPFEVHSSTGSMPGMDGLELINCIVVDPDLTAGVVLMTSMEPGSRAWRPRSGRVVRLAVPKPVHPADLRTCLQVALGWPVADVADGKMTVSAGPRPRGQKVGRLLLAEDNLINQKVAVGILSGAGYQRGLRCSWGGGCPGGLRQSYDADLDGLPDA